MEDVSQGELPDHTSSMATATAQTFKHTHHSNFLQEPSSPKVGSVYPPFCSNGASKRQLEHVKRTTGVTATTHRKTNAKRPPGHLDKNITQRHVATHLSPVGTTPQENQRKKGKWSSALSQQTPHLPGQTQGETLRHKRNQNAPLPHKCHQNSPLHFPPRGSGGITDSRKPHTKIEGPICSGGFTPAGDLASASVSAETHMSDSSEVSFICSRFRFAPYSLT